MMMATKVEKDNLECGVDNKTPIGANNNCSLKVASGDFGKETEIEARSETKLHFTMNFYKGFQLKINKPLLIVKLALFLWFAGSFGKMAYFFIFLKQRGLSVAHVSLAISTSVIFQMLGSSLSGIIADKIGRAKPVLFAHLLISIITSTTFMLMPPLTSESAIHHFELLSNASNYRSRSTADDWCNASYTIEQRSCKIYFSKNISNIPKEHCLLATSKENKTLFPYNLDDHEAEIFQNSELCCQDPNAAIPRDESFTICNSTFCENLEKDCLCEKRICSKSISMLLFIGYVFLIGVHYMAFSSVYRFYDLTVKCLVEEHHGDFGQQRLFSILGALIGSFSIVYFLKVTSSNNEKNYSLAFVFFNICAVLSGLMIWKVDIPVMEPAQGMLKKVAILLKNSDNIAFLILLMVLGTNFNFMLFFSNWYLEDLGASSLLLGLFMPLSSAFSLVFLFTSKWWLQNLGEHNIFIVALLGYGLFGIAFSYLREPWLALVFGAVACTFSYHLLWVAVIHHSHSIAPEGLYATVIVTAGNLHFIASRVTASMIGGMIMNAFGARIAFRVMGSGSFISAALYGSFHYFRRFYLQKV